MITNKGGTYCHKLTGLCIFSDLNFLFMFQAHIFQMESSFYYYYFIINLFEMLKNVDINIFSNIFLICSFHL